MIDITSLRDEANRLAQLEIDLLKDIQKTTSLLNDSAEQAQTLDPTSLPKVLEQLEGEQKKLKNLELVLAVVGTMKAGKSTTINAIVGMEILPNRNRPMTALPTLIRHTLGVKQPRLLFSNTQPINNLVKQLKPALVKASAEALKELNSNTDMQELIQRIQQQQGFSSEHIGSEAIFEFLKGLNDLVRLSTELEVDFPFAAYSQIDQLPVIEAEFTHLSEMQNVSGRLTLLDTPGPNEAGQKHLKPMMDDQLKKASAVLAVLDYTQLKSDADNEVRKSLESIAGVTGDRLYTLVNKFDQKDRNSDDAEAVKKYVAESLMKGIVSEDRVFPVSSRLGYLSGQAKNELAQNGKLPCHKTQPWVVDFAELAFGISWKSEIDDKKQVQQAIENLWEGSLFTQPLKQVVQQAYSNAAIYSVDSAATKTLHIAECIKNILSIRKRFFEKKVKDLNAQVKSLQAGLEKTAKHKQYVTNKVDISIRSLTSEVKHLNQKSKAQTVKTIDQYFEEGKRVKLPASLRKNRFSWLKGLGKFLFGNKKSQDESNEIIFTPGEIIEFKTRKEAEQLLDRIKDFLGELMDALSSDLKAAIDDEIEDFEDSLNGHIDLTNALSKRLHSSTSNLNIKIHLSRTQSIYMSDFVDDVLYDATEEVFRNESKWRRSSGVWGGLCELFDTDDWGWEKLSYKVAVYKISIPQLKEEILNSLNHAFERTSTSIEDDIHNKLNQQKQYFLDVLKKNIDYIKDNLLASISEKKTAQEEQAALLCAINELYHEILLITQNADNLNADIRKIIKA